MKNLLINSKNIIINGSLLCSNNIIFDYFISNEMTFENTISYDIILNGDLFIDGKIYFLMNRPLSSYPNKILSTNQDILSGVSVNILKSNLKKNYNKSDFKIIKSKNIYIFVNNFQIGNDMTAFHTMDKSINRQIKLLDILRKIQTKQNLNNINIIKLKG